MTDIVQVRVFSEQIQRLENFCELLEWISRAPDLVADVNALACDMSSAFLGFHELGSLHCSAT
jgi:hypothetical protein